MCSAGSFGLSKSNRLNTILIFLTILGMILCIAGGILIHISTSSVGYEIVIDYTDCMKYGYRQQTCKDYMAKTGKECTCYINVEINQTMTNAVTVFYELESFFSRAISQSRDDKQLAGHLSPEPSDSCGFYSYTNTPEGIKPIAPCGELADAMFNDSFTLQTNNRYVPFHRDGLISEDDKKNFKNPAGQNLQEAFKNFAKPINWTKNLWELDPSIPENNGFQNEALIIWMDPDLKRKPAWRVDHTGISKNGLPAGNYTLRIVNAYPPSRYDGRRKVIISSLQKIDHPVILGLGIFLMSIGLLGVILAGLIKMGILFPSRSQTQSEAAESCQGTKYTPCVVNYEFQIYLTFSPPRTSIEVPDFRATSATTSLEALNF